MKNQAKRMNNPQGGSVLVIILVGIVLFAALSYAVTQSMRGGMGNIDQERSKFAAREMIEYGQRLRDTVKELMITNGCTDTQITFEGATYYTPVSGYLPYTNPNAPASKKCHVFDAAGGGIRFTTPAQNFVDPGFSIVVAEHCHEGQGTGTSPCPATAKELEFNVVNIPKRLCQEVNTIANIGTVGSDPPNEEYKINLDRRYIGDYVSNDSADYIIEGIGASSKNFGCYMDNNGTFVNQYIFYYILLAR